VICRRVFAGCRRAGAGDPEDESLGPTTTTTKGAIFVAVIPPTDRNPGGSATRARFAAKPVMEGQGGACSKRFADIDFYRSSSEHRGSRTFQQLRRQVSSAGPGRSSIWKTSTRPRVLHHRASAADTVLDIPVFHDETSTAPRSSRNRGPVEFAPAHGRNIEDTQYRLATARAPVPAIRGPASELLERHRLQHENCAVRHQGRDLQGRNRGHEPVEVRARR